MLTDLFFISLKSSDDIALVAFYAGQNASNTAPCSPTQNQLLFNNVAFSEIMTPNLTASELAQKNNALTFYAAISTGLLQTRTLWSNFFNSALYDKIISPQTNVLVLGGQLDCQTPIENTQGFVAGLNMSQSMVRRLLVTFNK